MHVFYITPTDDNIAFLNEIDSRHCIRVLRMKIGDKVNLIDGVGGFYEGIVDSSNIKSVSIKILKKEINYGKKNYYLHIAISPTKNIDRFEWFIEKATEIGIDEITPILCHRTIRKSLQTSRLEKILISSIKQSIRTYLPILNPVTDYKTFIKLKSSGLKYIAYCSENENEHLINMKHFGRSYTIMIGPEGDFTDEEVIIAIQHEFQPISLGESRLRTETAGIVCCQIIADLNSLKLG